jgi:RHS repeat-associated protein
MCFAYYPFGMTMPGRTVTLSAANGSTSQSAYRYGFNGKEKSDEISSGAVSFEARIYDSRIGRFFSTDPREGEYAWQSTYVYFSNCPTSVLDVLGMGGTSDNKNNDKKDGNGAEPAGYWYRSSSSSRLEYLFISMQQINNGDIPKGYRALCGDETNRIVFGSTGDVSVKLKEDGTFSLVSPNPEVGQVEGSRKWSGKLKNGNSWGIRAVNWMNGDPGSFTEFNRLNGSNYKNQLEAFRAWQSYPGEHAGESWLDRALRLGASGSMEARREFAGGGYNMYSVIGGATFYRAMGNAEFAALKSSGGLSYMAGKELFVSSSANYSRAYLQKSGYDVLVQFNMKPGAMNYFNQVGVMHRTAAGASGWAARGSLLWKSEQGVMNLGIQSNTQMFNPWINSFKVIK